MLSRLAKGKKATGLKQTKRAITENKALCVFLAEDAEGALRAEVEELCTQWEVQLVPVQSMRALGHACGIEIGASSAVLLKD